MNFTMACNKLPAAQQISITEKIAYPMGKITVNMQGEIVNLTNKISSLDTAESNKNYKILAIDGENLTCLEIEQYQNLEDKTSKDYYNIKLTSILALSIFNNNNKLMYFLSNCFNSDINLLPKATELDAKLKIKLIDEKLPQRIPNTLPPELIDMIKNYVES